MKQPSTSTRGRKKSTTNRATASRGGATTQNRNRTNATRNSGSSGRTGTSSSGTSRSTGNSSNSSSSRSTSSTGGRSDNNRSGSSGNRSASGQNSTMRGNNTSSTRRERTGESAMNRERSSADRNRSTINHENRGADSMHHKFTGESHLEKFFLDQLQDIYYAENKIIQSLPKMAEAATTGELKEAFEDHLHQTQRHVKRLEKAFQSIGQKAEGKRCEAIEGIAREVQNIIDETEEGTLTRDAALIIAAQKVEHYEIATYGGLVQLAITMELHDAADLLDKTLVEEEDTDARLTEIAENEINLRAEHEDDQNSWNTDYSESEQEEEGGNDNEDESASVQ